MIPPIKFYITFNIWCLWLWVVTASLHAQGYPLGAYPAWGQWGAQAPSRELYGKKRRGGRRRGKKREKKNKWELEEGEGRWVSQNATSETAIDDPCPLHGPYPLNIINSGGCRFGFDARRMPPILLNPEATVPLYPFWSVLFVMFRCQDSARPRSVFAGMWYLFLTHYVMYCCQLLVLALVELKLNGKSTKGLQTDLSFL